MTIHPISLGGTRLSLEKTLKSARESPEEETYGKESVVGVLRFQTPNGGVGRM